jgi:hypothetical protein
MKYGTRRPADPGRRLTIGVLHCVILCGATVSIHAQDAADPTNSQTTLSGTGSAKPNDTPEADDREATGTTPTQHGGRLFGTLPNYSTVEGTKQVLPVSVRQKFRTAELNAFDPYVFPVVGVVAGLGAGQDTVSYGRRYTTALADNAIGNFMTTPCRHPCSVKIRVTLNWAKAACGSELATR